MKCPFCGYTESKVVDSRPTDDSERIRRRRECLRCQKRFTTYEVVETVPIIVIKKNGMQEPFDREKLLRGVLRACEKRPVPVEKLEKLVTDIETELQNSMQREVTSETIGELALAALREAKSSHDALEAVYHPHVDFDGVAALAREETNRILGYVK